jgi:putative ABC transport system permease protein
MMDAWYHDLRFAIAALRSSRWTAAVAILTIGLGTGVNTAVVAVAYGILLRPLPYADASRLVIVCDTEGADLGVPLDRVPDWQSRLRTTGPLGAYASGEFTMRGVGEPRTVRAAVVTPQFFDALGVRALGGQVFRSDDATEIAISGRLARQVATAGSLRPADAGAALTRSVSIGQTTYTIGAVMPEAFAFPSDEIEAWIPARSVAGVRMFRGDLSLRRVESTDRDLRMFHMIGRLAPGVTLQQSRDDARRVQAEVDAEALARPNARRASVRTLSDAVSGRVRPVLQAFVGAALLVLLVACANVATLLVGRFVAREREFAIRLAIGASVTRLVRTALAESLVLALGGSLCGLAIAAALLRLFVHVAGGVMPRLAEVTLDPPVLGATLLVTATVALLCGVGPAWSAARTNFAPAFRQTGVAGNRSSRRARAVLVTAQIALSIVLLTGAGLLTRTVVTLLNDDGGIQPDRALTMKLMLSESTQFDAASRGPFMQELLARIRALPGVESAGVGSNLPPRVSQLQFTVSFVGGSGDKTIAINLAAVTPGYLESLGARLVRGRLFEESDIISDAPILVISETAHRQFSPSEDLIGRELPFGLPRAGGKRVRPRVVGVVGDIKFKGLEQPAGGAMYVQWKDLPAGVSYLVVRTSGNPSSMATVVRDAVRRMDAQMPVPQLRTLGEEAAESIAERRLRVVPAIAFAVLALAVALVGLSGTQTRAVAERRRELAIRAAVGASPRQAVWLIVRDGALVSGVGLLVGIGAAAATGRALARLLYGVSPYDPLTFVAVAIVIAAATLAACYIPARRAARVEPLELLRE